MRPVSLAASVAVGTREVRRVAATRGPPHPISRVHGRTPRAGRPLPSPSSSASAGMRSTPDGDRGSPDAVAVATLRAGGRDSRIAGPLAERLALRGALRSSREDDRRYTVAVEWSLAPDACAIAADPTVSTAALRGGPGPRGRGGGATPARGDRAILVPIAWPAARACRRAADRRRRGRARRRRARPPSTAGGRRVGVRGGPWPVRPLTFVFATPPRAPSSRCSLGSRGPGGRARGAPPSPAGPETRHPHRGGSR